MELFSSRIKSYSHILRLEVGEMGEMVWVVQNIVSTIERSTFDIDTFVLVNVHMWRWI
jgi:hypothetical protein